MSTKSTRAHVSICTFDKKKARSLIHGLVFVLLRAIHVGADNNPNQGRLHTSLGSPYLGCSASGGMANLAKILGGCGANYDMTVDGATQWATTVSKANWAKVHFYTTTYDKTWCQKLMVCSPPWPPHDAV